MDYASAFCVPTIVLDMSSFGRTVVSVTYFWKRRLSVV